MFFPCDSFHSVTQLKFSNPSLRLQKEGRLLLKDTNRKSVKVDVVVEIEETDVVTETDVAAVEEGKKKTRVKVGMHMGLRQRQMVSQRDLMMFLPRMMNKPLRNLWMKANTIFCW